MIYVCVDSERISKLDSRNRVGTRERGDNGNWGQRREKEKVKERGRKRSRERRDERKGKKGVENVGEDGQGSERDKGV